MTEISEQFEDSLNKLKAVYRVKLKEEIPYFKNILEEPFTKELLEDLRMKVHKLSGSAGMYGFLELSTITHEFDIQLQEILKTDFTHHVHVIKDHISGIIKVMEII